MLVLLVGYQPLPTRRVPWATAVSGSSSSSRSKPGRFTRGSSPKVTETPPTVGVGESVVVTAAAAAVASKVRGARGRAADEAPALFLADVGPGVAAAVGVEAGGCPSSSSSSSRASHIVRRL